jgi:glycosyltransferase involved in cell wall biosynthesis
MDSTSSPRSADSFRSRRTIDEHPIDGAAGMKIVQLLAPAPVGGLERVVQGLAIGQRKRGHDVVIVAIGEQRMPEGHPFRVPIDEARVPLRQVIVGPRRYLSERAQIATLCRELSPDVVHGHGGRPDVIDGGVVRALGIATVSTHHGWTFGPFKNRIFESLHTRSLRRFDGVIAVSEPIARRLVAERVPSSRVHLLPNGFAPVAAPMARDHARRSLDLAPGARVAGWVGRLSQEKGIDVFVDAVARLADHGILGCVVGDGVERDRARAQADRVGARILWKGMIPLASRLAPAFDVFVQSSRTEGTPIALLEAIAAGIPVVATRVGGVPDVVSDQEAILVPPEDPSALANAIRAVFHDPGAAIERARRAKHRLVTTFSSDAWLARHEEIYTSAIAERRRRM